MQVLQPAVGRLGEVDRCDTCHVVWFGPLQFDALDRRAWVKLLLSMLDDTTSPGPKAGTAGAWRCPDCRLPLQATEGLTAHGRYGCLACPRGHGQVLGLTALLAARGCLRAPDLAERTLLRRPSQPLPCLSCGAAMDAHDDDCRHCGAPVRVVDLPRLARAVGAVDAGGAPSGPAPADEQPLPLRWSCHGCGQALDPTRQARCPQCHHPLSAPKLADLLPLLLQADDRLQREDRALRLTALRSLSEEQRQRIADLTGRPEHHAAVQRAAQAFWRRWALVAGGLVVMIVLVWMHAP